MRIFVPDKCRTVIGEGRATLFLPLEFQSDIVTSFTMTSCIVQSVKVVGNSRGKDSPGRGDQPPELTALGFSADPPGAGCPISSRFEHKDITVNPRIWLAFHQKGEFTEDARYLLTFLINYEDIGGITYSIELLAAAPGEPVALTLQRSYWDRGLLSFWFSLAALLLISGCLWVMLSFKRDVYETMTFSEYIKWAQTFLLTYFITRLAEKLVQSKYPLDLFKYPEFYLDNGLLKLCRLWFTPVVLFSVFILTISYMLPNYMPLDLPRIPKEFAYYDVLEGRMVTNVQVYRGYVGNIKIMFKDSKAVSGDKYVGYVRLKDEGFVSNLCSILTQNTLLLADVFIRFALYYDGNYIDVIDMDKYEYYANEYYPKKMFEYLRSGEIDTNHWVVKVTDYTRLGGAEEARKELQNMSKDSFSRLMVFDIDPVRYLTTKEMTRAYSDILARFSIHDAEDGSASRRVLKSLVVRDMEGQTVSLDVVTAYTIAELVKTKKLLKGGRLEDALEILGKKIKDDQVDLDLLTVNALLAAFRKLHALPTKDFYKWTLEHFNNYFRNHYSNIVMEGDERANPPRERTWRLWLRLLLQLCSISSESEQTKDNINRTIVHVECQYIKGAKAKLIYLEELVGLDMLDSKRGGQFTACYVENLAKLNEADLNGFLLSLKGRSGTADTELDKLMTKLKEYRAGKFKPGEVCCQKDQQEGK